MSEQLADHLQNTEISDAFKQKETGIASQSPASVTVPAAETTLTKEDVCNNDFMLAQLLQLEMDKEYDELLKEHENFKNKNIWKTKYSTF
jgi:hypothetical protein